MADKPRILHDHRDLMLTLIPLVLAALLIAGVASRCGVNQTKVADRPPYDVSTALRADAREFSFPIREPKLPGNWKPSSGGRDKIPGEGGGQVSTVGYLSPTGRYLKMSQSDASEASLLTQVAGQRAASGAEQVAGKTWVVYPNDPKEPAWVADFGQSRVLITGAGTPEQFAEFARAITQAAVLPKPAS